MGHSLYSLEVDEVREGFPGEMMLNQVLRGKLDLIRQEYRKRGKERMVWQIESRVCVKAEQWRKHDDFGNATSSV